MCLKSMSLTVALLLTGWTVEGFADQREELQKFFPSDGSPGDLFGFAVAMSETIAVIGANGAEPGAVYLYDLSTGQPLRKLWASNGHIGNGFGASVCIEGDTVIVGAPSAIVDGTRTGAVYVFDAATGQQTSRLLPSDGDSFDRFGLSLCVDGDTLVVGAPGDDDSGSNSGSAYLFDLRTRTQTHKLTSSDSTLNDQFGSSVGVTGNVVVVGAPQDDDDGRDSGSLYVFDASLGVEVAKVRPDDGAPQSRFGLPLDVDSSSILVGAFNKVYVFDLSTRQQRHHWNSPCGDIGFGAALALQGDRILVGSPTAGVDRDGAAYLIDLPTGDWIAKLQASDGETNDLFGLGVAQNSNGALIGAAGNDPGDDSVDNSGAAYLYDATGAPNPCLNPPIHYGKGTSGTFGVPYLSTIGCPTLGNESFAVEGDGFLPDASGLLFVGFARADLDMGGWTLLVDLVATPRGFVIPVSYPGGRLHVPMPIPSPPQFDGLSVNLQCVSDDPGAPAGTASTEGLELRISCQSL